LETQSARRFNAFEADGCAPLHQKRHEVQNLIGYFKVGDGNGLVLKQSLFFSGSNHFKEKFCASECLLRQACHASLFKTHHTLDMNTTTDKERREFGLRR